MGPVLERHPLRSLLAREHTTAAAYLKRVADRHQVLGYGQMAHRKEKFSRWISGTEPELTAQLAMADLHGIDPEEVHRRGWPDWLLLALCDDRSVWELPWTVAGTVEALEQAGGGPVDRRGFVIASLGTLAVTGAHWAATTPAAVAAMGGRRVGAGAAELFETRLDTLRHLDDAVGSAHAYQAAVAELRLITGVLTTGSYTDATGRRLYAAAAEACRLAGWCAYDSGHLADAEKRFTAALRAAAIGDDATLGASTLAFWANLRYSCGDPYGALGLVERALDHRHKITSGRVLAMLHARQARAHSKAGEPAAAYRAIDAAFAAYDRAGPTEHDLPSMYWMTHGEVHEVAASCALSLGEPQRALEHFDAALRHEDPYDAHTEARGAGIYLARQAEAHLALGDIDAAVAVAERAIEQLGGADSARGTSTLADLRGQLAAHRKARPVADFLDLTA
ncbi:tetratricopeptide (TPR) repeat protein [Streptomyces olivoverticillatus]|uniref:Tetratricopeptide (TPR) repeat protein n=1 Tax=Streptomyces olivoverticillatus TaxID=66427 RepID=A0A7W7LKE3_9ACTN|nr:transcriptional regulator [Streptomyces olivoverticillatus]MBB4891226.1 tetratricopeptide (TPR) repeat protein [Streptomyces olivoverticillatus]